MAKLPLTYLRVIRASSMSQTIVKGFHSMVEIVCIQVTVEELSYEMMLKRSDTIFREVHPCSDVHEFGKPTHSFFQNKRHDARVKSMHSHVTRFRVGVLAFVYAWSSFFVSYRHREGSPRVCAKHNATHAQGDSIRGRTRTTSELRHEVKIRSIRPVHPMLDPHDWH